MPTSLTFAGDAAFFLIFVLFALLTFLILFLPRKIDIFVTPHDVTTRCILRRRVLLPPLTVLLLWTFYVFLFLELPWWWWQYQQHKIPFDEDPLAPMCEWDACFDVNPFYSELSITPNTEGIRLHKLRILAEAWYSYGRLLDGEDYWVRRPNASGSVSPLTRINSRISWTDPEV